MDCKGRIIKPRCRSMITLKDVVLEELKSLHLAKKYIMIHRERVNEEWIKIIT